MKQIFINTLRLIVLIFVISLTTTACQEKQPAAAIVEKTTPAAETSQQVPPETETSVVAAIVNGEAITEADIEFTINKTFNSAELMLANESIKDKVLQSLIASRAMKHIMQKSMDKEQQQAIAKKVKAYEEELYIKAYLRANVTPEPVSAEMVKNWYEQNPQRYGGVEVKQFELLKTVTQLSEKKRNELLATISEIQNTDNWQKHSKQWQKQYQLVYQIAQAQPGLLAKQLQQVLNKLQQGQTSEVILHQGDIYLLRVTKVTQLPPRPLSEVSASIRKTLAPLQLKKAVKKASQEAIKQAKVELKTKPPT